MEVGDGDLVAIGVLLKNVVVELDGGGITAVAIVDLGLIVV